MHNVTPVFIPGLLCTEWLFHGQADIAHGKAVFADTRQHNTITGMAEAALTQTSGQLVPIGVSMGGYVALEMARLAPERISAMALQLTANTNLVITVQQVDQRVHHGRPQELPMSTNAPH